MTHNVSQREEVLFTPQYLEITFPLILFCSAIVGISKRVLHFCINQIFKNHSALQSELFSHLCELTYRTGSWNNLFQYLLLNMSWPGSIKAFLGAWVAMKSLNRGGENVCYSWLLQGTVAHCSFLWAHCRLWLPIQALCLCWGSSRLMWGGSCPALLKWGSWRSLDDGPSMMTFCGSMCAVPGQQSDRKGIATGCACEITRDRTAPV